MGLPIAEEYGGSGADYTSYCLALEEITRACASTGLTYEAHISLGCMPIYLLRHRGAEARVSARALQRGEPGLLRPHRAGGRLRRRRHARPPPVLEDGEWVINGSKCFITNASYAKFVTITAITDKGTGTARHQRHHRAHRHARVHRPSGLREDGPARLQHHRALLRRRARAREEPRGRAGRGLQAVPGGARRRPHRHRRHGRGHRSGLPGRLAQVRQGARAVRPAHRQVPGHPVQAGRHGHERRAGPATCTSRPPG